LKDALTFDSTYNSAINFDARLTTRGEAQCADLARQAPCENATLITTSPMTRCVQTSLLGFPNLVSEKRVKVVAREELRETANYWCDRRRDTEELVREFGNVVDFSSCPATDELWSKYEIIAGPPDQWTKHRESCDLYAVAERVRDFFAWLETQPEDEVIVSTHSALLRCIFSYGHPGGVRGAPDQVFDSGGVPNTADGAPIVYYPKGDDAFEQSMREDFDNCEYRTCVVDFSPRSGRIKHHTVA
jgi:broad specificity phosphatase PhoE